jgi:predicted DNA-binding transcriptional regulator AlpA
VDETKAVVAALIAQGWRVERGKHYKAFAPDGKSLVVLSATPGDRRAIRNAIGQLRRGWIRLAAANGRQLMGEYAVTITSGGGRQAVELDALADTLPTDAALSIDAATRKISATFSVVADSVYDATALGGRRLVRAMRAAGMKDFTHTEVHAMDWESYERQLEAGSFPDIVSAPEVAEILGVSRQRVHQLLNDHATFPPPIVRVGSGPLWLRATIEAYDRSWVRKPGRPRVAS